MANTVTILSYANTFGEWLTATDALIAENNNLAANDYTKTSGTLYLNETTKNSLQANGTVIVQKQLLVQGTGSSATIDNNLTVGKQVYFSNTTLGLTNSGQANINGLLIAQGPNTSLFVANNTQMNGTLNVGGTANIWGTTTVTNNFVVTANTYSANLTANVWVTTPRLKVSTLIDGNGSIAYVDTLVANYNIITSGNFVINGTTVYSTNTFTINAGAGIALDSYYNVNRGSSGANASIRWSESNKYFDIKNVTSNTFYRILTDEYLVDNVNSTSSTSVATANAANTLNNYITTVSTQLQGVISTGVTSANATATAAFFQANAAYLQANAASSRANTSANSFNGTNGTITPTNGSVTFTSNNGVALVATSANTFAVSTPQDLRTTSTPSFTGLSLTSNPLGYSSGGTNATSASAAFQNLIYGHIGSYGTAGYVLTTNGSGTYYWAAGGTGGGSGTTPGTTIVSTRSSYVANGASSYTGNSFNVPAATTATQVRAYINGVRQFESEYNLSLTPSSNTINFYTTPTNGDNILIEVDGYYVNPYYANNIAYTINATIGASANTIQLALDGLASIVALKSGTTFTGDAQGITMAIAASNTSFATTAFVKNVLNSSGTYSINTSGNAGTVTNGVYTANTYSDPAWLTSLAWSKISSKPTTVSGYGITDLALYNSNYANVANTLTSTSNYQVNSFGVGTAPSGTLGEIRAANNIIAYYTSDIRFKENIRNIPNATEKVVTIGGKLFNWTDEYIESHGGEDDYFNRKEDFGVIAQDVEKCFPVAVRKKADGTLAVDYEKLCALAFASIVELKAEIDALKEKNKG